MDLTFFDVVTTYQRKNNVETKIKCLLGAYYKYMPSKHVNVVSIKDVLLKRIEHSTYVMM